MRVLAVVTALLALAVASAEPPVNAPIPNSQLAKFVLMFSRPGAFSTARSVLGEEEEEPATTSCPPGDRGLDCRRAEARRLYDTCPGGECEKCAKCEEVSASEWPGCCRHNSLCCSHLAAACQKCDRQELKSFCSKHFKRCFT